MNRVKILFVTALMLLGIGVLTAPPAAAGGCYVYGTICGRVTNMGPATIQIAKNWYPNMPASEKHTLAAGHNSWEYPLWKDTDAAWSPCPFQVYLTYNQITHKTVPSGPIYQRYVWYKLNDLTHWYVTTLC